MENIKPEDMEWEEWVDYPENEINRTMVRASFADARVRIIGPDDVEYIGRADCFTHAADEDDYMPVLLVMKDGGGGIALSLAEIKSIEILDD